MKNMHVTGSNFVPDKVNVNTVVFSLLMLRNVTKSSNRRFLSGQISAATSSQYKTMALEMGERKTHTKDSLASRSQHHHDTQL